MSQTIRNWTGKREFAELPLEPAGGANGRSFVTRREARRFLNTTIVVDWTDADGRAQVVRTRTVNVSKLGIGIALDAPILVSSVTFSLPELRCSGSARVCYVQLVGELYRIGLEVEGQRLALPSEELPVPSAEDWLLGEFW